MSKFGWSYPPGCTQRMIDDLSRCPACEVCGGDPEGDGTHTFDCKCPECPVCGVVGDPLCYKTGHMA